MVRSKDEILASIKSRIGDDTSDEAIALIEDINARPSGRTSG